MSIDNTEDIVDQLRAGIGRIPAEVQPGLARRAYRRNRRRTTTRVAGAAGTVTAAAAAAVLVATSTSAPQASAPAAAGPKAAPKAAASSPLLTLAAHITANSTTLPGNASLIIQSTQLGQQAPIVSYNLYTDSGAIYGGDNKTTLGYEIRHHLNSAADGYDARQVAAARAAASGNLSAARVEMVLASGGNPLGLGLSPAARQKLWDKTLAQTNQILKEKGSKTRLPAHPPTGQALQAKMDNYVWINSTGALSEGGGSPQVRAGVLRLLSTISGVTVTQTTTGGQPTLTLTAGPEVFGGSGKNVVVINAKTGMPISSWSGDNPPSASTGAPTPDSMTTYQVSRVTLSKVEAGKF